jgi:hypothetical protein
MATLETLKMDSIISRTRRSMMLLAGTALAASVFTTKKANAAAVTDTDILNFALNLEYLEANFYSLADSGQTIDQLGIGVGAGTTATGTVSVATKSGGPAACKVPFTSPIIAAYCKETAVEERAHVTDLRGALGASAVAQPSLDLVNSFLALGGLIGAPTFDPFANDLFFLLGAYIFEDVGVSAYHGAAPLITDKTKVLPAAVAIHAVEAYHAGLVRTSLYLMDAANPAAGIAGLTAKISGVRATLDGTVGTTADDHGIASAPVALNGTSANFIGSNIVDADANSLGWARSTTQVLNIVYASAATAKGGFYPNGLNGTIA